MPRKPTLKPDDPAQSKRFVDLAHEVEPTVDKKEFDRALKKIALSPKKVEKPS